VENIIGFFFQRESKKRCEFIDYEAILSDDSYQTTSGESDENSSSTKLDSFICEEHPEEEIVDMEAKYLQSVR
jgi:hypothetical protein